MTQAAAAERLGVSQTTVSAWERDVGVASVRDLRRLLALYGATDADRLSVLAVEASP
jgi:transcriptional regulator with XRE-family HTH domain